MSLPTPVQLQTLDYVYLGAPFVWIPAKSSLDLNTLDFVYLGAPFDSNMYASPHLLMMMGSGI